MIALRLKKALFLFLLVAAWLHAGQEAANNPIRVNQIGYRPLSLKVAVFVDAVTGYNAGMSFTPASEFYVKRASDNETVYTGTVEKVTPRIPLTSAGADVDSFSGDRTWNGDFTDFQTPGEYYIECNGQKSYNFVIDDAIYHKLFKHVMRWYFFQRQGIPITAQHGKHWTHSGAYMQDTQAKDAFDGGPVKDVSRGWWDAGDPTKYVHFAGPVMPSLMIAYEISQIQDDNWDLPESGNGIPDMLDEIKWQIDFFLNAQRGDGGVHNRVTNRGAGCEHFQDPGNDKSERYYTRVTTYSTAVAGASMAHFAYLFRQYDQAYADRCIAGAKKAFTYLQNNPQSGPGEDHNGDKLNCGASGGGSDNRYRELLGISLYRATGEKQYLDYVHDRWDFLLTSIDPDSPNELHWDGDNGDKVKYIFWIYVQLADGEPAKKEFIRQLVNRRAQEMSDISSKEPYGLAHEDWQYWWGFNGSLCNRGAVAHAANSINAALNTGTEKKQEYLHAAERQLHYILGANATNTCYLSNLGSKAGYADMGAENSVQNVFHGWYGSPHYNNPNGPVPAALVGGPNIGLPGWDFITWEPPSKAFYDQTANTSYPTGKPWAFLEPAIYYQSGLVFLMAGLMGDLSFDPPEGKYRLDISTVGSGVVTVSPSGSYFDPGTVVELTASPGNKQLLSTWSGDASGAEKTISITMDGNKQVTATFATDPNAPIITNGDFTNSEIGWKLFLFQHEATNAQAALSISNSAASISISDAGSSRWHVQMLQENIQLPTSNELTFQFNAKASANRTIEVSLKVLDGETFVNETINLTTTDNTFTFSLPAISQPVTGARLEFNLGTSTEDVVISNVVVNNPNATNTAPHLESSYSVQKLSMHLDQGTLFISGLSAKQWNIDLYDLMGKRLASKSGKSASGKISLAGLQPANGIIIAKINSGNNSSIHSLTLLR